MARVKLIENKDARAEAKELFEKLEANGSRILNLQKALAHSPRILRDFIRLGNSLLYKTALPDTLRELAILRVGALTNAHYEWTQHVRVALRTGVPQEQIDAVHHWKHSPAFNDTERAVLKYTDEQTLHIRVSDETFNGMRNFLNEQEIIELTVTIGYYGMVSRVLETLQVELES
ncbi:MAG: carboxymuconolactone decarboxylase family protein [Deltaproteobacteria bacterium]|nr:carboxymuconolactone decarboxylase family protein [Deltaproteobacteria bacterium]